MDDQVIQNIFNQAKLALNNDAKTQIYNSLEARTQAFRKINQGANARKAMFSGMPAAQQLQQDATVTIPTGANIVMNAVQKMQKNQESWNEYAKYIKETNEKVAEIESAMK